MLYDTSVLVGYCFCDSWVCIKPTKTNNLAFRNRVDDSTPAIWLVEMVFGTAFIWAASEAAFLVTISLTVVLMEIVKSER